MIRLLESAAAHPVTIQLGESDQLDQTYVSVTVASAVVPH